MRSLDLIRKLVELGMPVFTIETAGAIMQRSAGYTRLYINRMHRKGLIYRVEKGLYSLPDTDEYTIASRIVPYSYITSYGALSYYGLTTQIPSGLQIISPKYHRKIVVGSYTATFSKVKKEYIYGYSALFNGPAIAEPEKVFIDDLYMHRRMYYEEEFTDAITRGKLLVGRFEDYAIRSGDKAVVSLAGYYLERCGIRAEHRLLEYRSRSYLRLGMHGVLDSRWRVYG